MTEQKSMTYKERREHLETLLDNIKREKCISIKCIADKFNCSESTVKRMISDLRDEGNDIIYCRVSKRFKIKP